MNTVRVAKMWVGTNLVTFEAPDTEEAFGPEITIDKKTWASLGNPRVLEITFESIDPEPADKQNGDNDDEV